MLNIKTLPAAHEPYPKAIANMKIPTKIPIPPALNCEIAVITPHVPDPGKPMVWMMVTNV